ncbi:MAG: MBL fold metallo-hydrolase [Sedimentibacter sp.]|uniref:MBL fold metallo-hydrolase n=1 Tax=Sedimentibacter sp. TaxID=1960295 RepID=UPI0031597101
MKVTVIGCWGGFPKAGEATSGYLLEHGGCRLLLECGSGVVSLLQQKADLGDLDGVIITHYHYDHCCDIGPLQYARQIKTQLGQIHKPLPIYAPDGEFFKLLKWEDYTYGQSFSQDSIISIGPFEASFIKNVHPVEAYSVKITCEGRTLAFTSDTSYFEELNDFFYCSDLLISECSFYDYMDGTKAGHLNSAQAGMLAEKAQVKKLILTHLPHFGNLEDLMAQAKQNYSGQVLLAEKFMEIEL